MIGLKGLCLQAAKISPTPRLKVVKRAFQQSGTAGMITIRVDPPCHPIGTMAGPFFLSTGHSVMTLKNEEGLEVHMDLLAGQLETTAHPLRRFANYISIKTRPNFRISYRDFGGAESKSEYFHLKATSEELIQAIESANQVVSETVQYDASRMNCASFIEEVLNRTFEQQRDAAEYVPLFIGPVPVGAVNTSTPLGLARALKG